MEMILFEDFMFFLVVNIWIFIFGIKIIYKSERLLSNLIKYNKFGVFTLGGVINFVFLNLVLFRIYFWVFLFLYL